MQQIVLGALVLLAIVNTCLIVSIYRSIKKYHRDLVVETCDTITKIESLERKCEFGKLDLMQEIQRVRSSIQSLPKQITVKNVLSI